jgi:hypothetical protein
MGHNLSAGVLVNFLALFREEVNSAGTTGIAFHPVVTAALGVGYAF